MPLNTAIRGFQILDLTISGGNVVNNTLTPWKIYADNPPSSGLVLSYKSADAFEWVVSGITEERLITTSGDIISQIPSLDGYATELYVDAISGSLHAEIENIDLTNYYTKEEITTISGDIIAQIPADYISDAEMTTISGDLVDQILAASGTTNHSLLTNLDYTSAGHTGFQPAGDYVTTAELITISGDIIAQIPIDYISDSEITIISGDIVSQIPSLSGYATESWVSTNYTDNAEITTISGDIVAQIPSLSGYATESYVTTVSGDIIDQIPTDYITNAEMTVISGDIIAQISGVAFVNLSDTPSDYTSSSGLYVRVKSTEDGLEFAPVVGGIANHSELSELDYANAGHTGFQPAGSYATTAQLTTTSGDIVNQIPSDYISDSEMTVISGDIINQIPSLVGYATEEYVTTVSGDIVLQIPDVSNFVTDTEVTTISGDIVIQIPAESLRYDYNSSLAYMVSVTSGTKHTVVVDCNNTVTTNISIPGDIQLFFVKGCITTITSGITLTIYSPSNVLAKQDQQIFTGDGLVRFLNPGVLYPEWWGIDGVADNIQADAAYDSLLAGGAVKFTAASYSFEIYSTIHSNIITDIDRWTTITLEPATITGCAIFFANGENNIEICGGGTVDGNRSYVTAGDYAHNIYLANCSRVVLRDFKSKSAHLDNIYITSCTNVRIQHCDIEDSGSNGATLVDSKNVKVIGNYFKDNLNIAGTADLIPYIGCIDVIITQNTFKENGVNVPGQCHAIFAQGVTGLSIFGNYAEDKYGNGIELQPATTKEGQIVFGNHIRNCGNEADGFGGIYTSGDNNLLFGNFIKGSALDGILMTYTSGSVVGMNIINDSGDADSDGYGIRSSVGVTNSILIGNSINDDQSIKTMKLGITLPDTPMVVIGNTVGETKDGYIAWDSPDADHILIGNYMKARSTNYWLGDRGVNAVYIGNLVANAQFDRNNFRTFFVAAVSSDKNLNPYMSWHAGDDVWIKNTGASYNIVFDSTGLNHYIAPSESGYFIFNGTVWNSMLSTDHSILSNLDYENSGHTGFASFSQLSTASGDILSQVADGYISNSEMTTISGDIMSQVTVISGDIISQIFPVGGLTDDVLPVFSDSSHSFVDSTFKKSNYDLQLFSADSYPSFVLHAGAGHDDCGISFDAYSTDGINWYSSDDGSNFIMYKYNNMLTYYYASNIPQGSGISSWLKFLEFTSNGTINIHGTTNVYEILNIHGDTSAMPTKGWINFGTSYDTTAFTATSTDVSINKLLLYNDPYGWMAGFGVSDGSFNMMSAGYIKIIGGYIAPNTGKTTALIGTTKIAVGDVQAVPWYNLEVQSTDATGLVVTCTGAPDYGSYEYIGFNEQTGSGALPAYIARYNTDYLYTAGRKKLRIVNNDSDVEIWAGVSGVAYQNLLINGSDTYGRIEVGVDDTRTGEVYIYGAWAGISGGILNIYTGADHDYSINNYSIRVVEDDLLIGTNTDLDILKLDANKDFYITNGSIVLPNSEYINFSGTQGSDGYGFRDNSGVIEYKNYGGIWSTFSGGVSNHAELSGLGNDDHIQYHNDLRGDARYYTQAQTTTISGDIVAQIPTSYISDAEMTMISGDIVSQIPLLTGYATEAHVTTVSGDIVAQIPSDYISDSEITTISGDIVWQIPTTETIQNIVGTSLSGINISVSYDDITGITTLSGNLGGGSTNHSTLSSLDYASSGHTGFQPAGNYATTTQLTTTSGDIVSQIPIDYISDVEMATISGNIVEQIQSINFVELLDVPSSYIGEANKYIRVNESETGLVFSTVSGSSTDYYTIEEVDVISGALHQEIVNVSGATSFIGLFDTPTNYTASSGLYVKVKSTEDGLEFVNGSFLSLVDTPSSYSSDAGKIVAVNMLSNALEFISAGSANLDGGYAGTNYGGTTSLDGGNAFSF